MRRTVNNTTVSHDEKADDALPIAFRGYSRDATDRLLGRIEESYRALLTERDQLRARAEETEGKLAEHEGEVAAVGRALVRAEQIRAEAELEAEATVASSAREAAERLAGARAEAEALLAAAESQASALRDGAQLEAEAAIKDAEAARATSEREGQELTERAKRDADAIMREAEARAARLVEDARSSIEERRHEAEAFLDTARERLASLVQDLIVRVQAIPEAAAAPDPGRRGLASESALVRESASEAETSPSNITS